MVFSARLGGLLFKVDQFAEWLYVTQQTIYNWLSRINKDNKEQRDCEIRRLWFTCQTQEKIFKAVGMTQQGVKKVIQQTEDFRFVVLPGIHREIEDEEQRWTLLSAHLDHNFSEFPSRLILGKRRGLESFQVDIVPTDIDRLAFSLYGTITSRPSCRRGDLHDALVVKIAS